MKSLATLLFVLFALLPFTRAYSALEQPALAAGGSSAVISSPQAPNCPTCAKNLGENVGCKQGYSNPPSCARTFEAELKEVKPGKTEDTNR